MNEKEKERFNKLAARVHVQQLVLVELCRRNFTSDEIAAFLAPLDDVVVASGDPDLPEALNEALAKFRAEIMLPVVR